MKLPVWSYTFLSTYARCPKQASARWVERTYPFVETPELKRGNDVHSCMEQRITNDIPLPPDMQQWEHYGELLDQIATQDGVQVHAELKLAVRRDWSPCGFFDNDVWGRGKADVTIRNSTYASLMDWKTGKPWEDPLELEIQAVLLQAAYPELKTISGAYIWLKTDEPGTVYDLSDTAKTRAWIEKTMADAEKSNFWVPKRNALCGWCALDQCPNWRERK